MRRTVLVLAILFALEPAAGAVTTPKEAAAASRATANAANAKTVTTKKLIKRFKRVTKGDRLTRDARASWAGVDALGFGRAASQAKLGKYGHFVLYVARPASIDPEVERLLADIHTAEPITPNRKGVRWERNVSLRGGGHFWTAKTKYARNVVLIWNGFAKKGVTPAWKRLHMALRKATR